MGAEGRMEVQSLGSYPVENVNTCFRCTTVFEH